MVLVEMVSEFYLGVAIAFISSVFFASSGVTTRRGVYGGGVYSTVLISVLIGIPMYLTALKSGVTGMEIPRLSPYAVALFMLAGIVHFVLGRFTLYYAIHEMGSSASYPIMSTSNVLSAIIAIPILGEILSINKVFSVVIVSVGIYFMAVGNIYVREFRRGFPPALLTAFLFASSSLLVRAALLINRAPITGVLISYSTSIPFLIGLLGHEEYLNELITLDRVKLGYMVLNGILVNMGQFFRYISLNMVEVSIVGIVFSGTPLLTILLSYLVNRDIELINRRIVYSSILIVIGIILIVV